MDHQELIEKYRSLLEEVNRLKIENSQLKAELGLREPQPGQAIQPGTVRPSEELNPEGCSIDVNNSSDSVSKIRLFMSLFKGRADVYAKRWENPIKGTAGYSPVCLNQWQPGICEKPKIPCSKCNHTSYDELNESVMESHLRGRIVVGIYPMLPDDTCHFLALDFDKGDWKKDVSAIREVCLEFKIPIAVERSRSGNGCHVWFFFEHPVAASLARKFGTSLLTSELLTWRISRCNGYEQK